MRQAGADHQSIKNKIANTYRDQYKTAYLNDDTDRMYEIEDVLDSTEFSFDYKKWRKDADKKQEED